MNTTESYATFVEAAASLNHECGVAQWTQEAPPIGKYNAVGLLGDGVAAAALVRAGDIAGVEISLSSVLKRNVHRLLDPSIHNYFNCPRYCVEDYINADLEFIRVYASFESTTTTSAESNNAADAASARGKKKELMSAASTVRSAQPLCPRWVQMDVCSHADIVTTPPLPFLPLWDSALEKAALKRFSAVAAGGTALPPVDITAAIEQAW
jgi:hypothetical protein